MKEVVIISGKGGTGKTSFTAAMSELFSDRVMADCDVDAANLNLVLNAEITETFEFVSGHRAAVDPAKCVACGRCRDVCRYDAISPDYVVDGFACEGCGACYFLCPVGAVTFEETLCGHYFTGRNAKGQGSTFAELLPGAENSGKLVMAVRTKAKEMAEGSGSNIILTDGPPGIGCTVIASLTGASFIVFVTEPTVSGVHDLKRVMDLANFFKLPGAVVINKADLNSAFCDEIQQLCEERGFGLLGLIPYEPLISQAQRQARTILSHAPDCPASMAIREIHQKLIKRLETD